MMVTHPCSKRSITARAPSSTKTSGTDDVPTRWTVHDLPNMFETHPVAVEDDSLPAKLHKLSILNAQDEMIT